MRNQPHITGPLPEVDPSKFTVGAAWQEHFSHETMIWLGWLVRSEYAEISAIRIVAANRASTSIDLEILWEKPLDEVFASTIPAADTPLDSVMDRLADITTTRRTGRNRFERDDYMPPLPSRPDLMGHSSHSRFQSCAWITVHKPKSPARPRGANWVAQRLRTEMKKRGYEHHWPQAAYKNFQLWLDLDGKDIHIVRPRDLSEEPLPRRLKLRSKNGQQTKSSPGMDNPQQSVGRVARRSRRFHVRNRV
jgi:hypothetical protein